MRLAPWLIAFLLATSGIALAQTPSLGAHADEPCGFVLPHGIGDLHVVRAAIGPPGDARLRSWSQVIEHQASTSGGGTCQMLFPEAISTRFVSLTVEHTPDAGSRYCTALGAARRFTDFPLRMLSGLGDAAFVHLTVVVLDGSYLMRATVTAPKKIRDQQLVAQGVAYPDLVRTRAFLRAVIAGLGPLTHAKPPCA
jgi:hypothetical protein